MTRTGHATVDDLLKHPGTRTVTVHHPDGRARVIGADGRLTGGDVLPGFELPVGEIFAPPQP